MRSVKLESMALPYRQVKPADWFKNKDLKKDQFTCAIIQPHIIFSICLLHHTQKAMTSKTSTNMELQIVPILNSESPSFNSRLSYTGILANQV